MRILHVVHHFPPESIAGCERYVLELVQAQATAGHHVHVLTRSIMSIDDGVLDDWDARNRVSVSRVWDERPYMDDWYQFHVEAAENDFATLVREFKPEVVHLHHWLSLSLTLLGRVDLSTRCVVITIHDLFGTCPTGHRILPDGGLCERDVNIDNCYPCLLISGDRPTPFSTDPEELSTMLAQRTRALDREFLSADRIVFADDGFRRFYRRFRHIDDDRTRVVPLPVADLPAQSPPANPERIHIGYFGSINKWKAPHLLLEAIRLLPEWSKTRISVTILGMILHTDYREKLFDLATGLDVVFHDGFYDLHRLPEFAFDFCVFPSTHFESYSFVVSEAIKMEVPLVVSDTGAPAHRIGDCGLTFRQGDARDLSEKIAQLIASPSLRTRCRDACRTHKARLPDMPEHAARLASLYEDVLRAKSAVHVDRKTS
ncbi:MAG: glycosyltransferase [Proteobacteria bacterium]|nr:MAG: glycosyltransferase [Pseudomonadota bacterium]